MLACSMHRGRRSPQQCSSGTSAGGFFSPSAGPRLPIREPLVCGGDALRSPWDPHVKCYIKAYVWSFWEGQTFNIRSGGRTRPTSRDVNTSIAAAFFSFFFFFFNGSPLSKSHVEVREKGHNFRVEPQSWTSSTDPTPLKTTRLYYTFAKLESKTCPRQLNSDMSGRAYLQLCLQGKIKPCFIHPSVLCCRLICIQGHGGAESYFRYHDMKTFGSSQGSVSFLSFKAKFISALPIITWIFNKRKSDTIMNK